MRFHFQTILEDLFGASQGVRIPVLYGGSVSAGGAAELLLNSHMDGLGVGRAALDATAFANLIESCLPATAMRR
jgi:triosephosphate isomerase